MITTYVPIVPPLRWWLAILAAVLVALAWVGLITLSLERFFSSAPEAAVPPPARTIETDDGTCRVWVLRPNDGDGTRRGAVIICVRDGTPRGIWV